MKVTLFNAKNDPVGDGLPLVYEGHLTREQIVRQARELGGIGHGGYEGVEVARTSANEFLVTYASEAPYEKEPYGEEGERVLFDEQGELSYEVVLVHTSKLAD